jgi:hypothetical protein
MFWLSLDKVPGGFIFGVVHPDLEASLPGKLLNQIKSRPSPVLETG